MSRRHAPWIALIALTWAGTAPAADIRLSVVSRSHVAGGMMLRAELDPDLPGLAARDFGLTVRPAEPGPSDPPPRPVRFIARRLRGAYYFDIRRLPALPKGRYVLRLTLTRDGRRVAGAALAKPITYAPPQLDVALVIDQSFSMRRTDPERLRVAAAKTFVDLAASGKRIRSICVVAFDAESHTLIPLTPAADRPKLHAKIGLISELGQINIDAALRRAHGELIKGESAGKAAVLLTDGRNQPTRYANAHRAFARSGWPVYTIGLSKEADAETLGIIARKTGGRFYDAPTNDKLREIFSRICFALERHARIRKSSVRLAPGQRHTETVPVDDTVTRAVFSARADRADVALSITPPTRRHPAALQSSARGPFRFFVYHAPAAGPWKASVRGGAAPAGVELDVEASTELYPVLFPMSVEYGHADLVEVVCSLAHGIRPAPGAVAEAVARTAAGKTITAPLTDEGGGVYAGTFPRIPPGTFDLIVTVRGKTRRGNPFERQVHARSRVAPRRKPEIWASARSIDLGTLYNTETAAATVQVQKLLPPDTDHELRARCLSAGLPAGALAVELGTPDAAGRRTLKLSAAVPIGQAAARHRATLRLTLGPETTRDIPVRLQVVNPRIVVRPASLRFGTMLGGARAGRRVQLRAEPRGALNVTLGLSGAVAAHIAELDRTSLRLDPKGAVVAITVAVPDEAPAGVQSGALTVTGDFEKKTVPLSLTVVRTELAASPAELDFGDLKPGQSSSRKLRLRVTGPAAVEAAAAADFGGRLPAAALSLHDTKLRLSPTEPVELDVVLSIPPARQPGTVRGVVRFSTDRAIGSVPVRAAVLPATTFALEPETVRFNDVELGRRSARTLTLRSTIHVPQEVRIEPQDGSVLIVPDRTVVRLAPGASATVTLTCLPPLDTPPGDVRRTFRLAGPLLPRSLTARADVVPPAGGTFRINTNHIPLGELRPGGERSGHIAVTSAVDVPQTIALAPDRSAEHSAWIWTSKDEVTLEPHGTVRLPFRCTVFPGASDAESRRRIAVRGPLDSRPVTVGLRITAPPRPAPSSAPLHLLLLLLIALLAAAAAYVAVWWVFQMPCHPMIKYLAASGVLNVAFFILIIQIVGSKKAVRELYMMIRLDDSGAVAAVAAAPSSPTDQPMLLEDRITKVEPEKHQTDAPDPRKETAEAERAKLEASRKQPDRERAELDSKIETPKPELSKMTAEQLEQIAAAAEQVTRKLEQAAERKVEPTRVVKPRAQAESEERKQLEAARRLAHEARELQMKRARRRAADPQLERPDSRTRKLSTGTLETLLAAAKAGPRRSEAMGETRAPTTQVGRSKATPAGTGERPGAAARPASRRTEARNTHAEKTSPAAAGGAELVARRSVSAKQPTEITEPVLGEAKASPRRSAAVGIRQAPAAGIAAARKSTPGGGAKRVTAAAAGPLAALTAKEAATARGRTSAALPGAELIRRAAKLPAAPAETVGAEIRRVVQTQASDAPTRRIGAAPVEVARARGTSGAARRGAAPARSSAPVRPAAAHPAKPATGAGAAGGVAVPKTVRQAPDAPEFELSAARPVAPETGGEAAGVALRASDVSRPRSAGRIAHAERAAPPRPTAGPAASARKGDVLKAKVTPRGTAVLGVPTGSLTGSRLAQAPAEPVEAEARGSARRRAAEAAPGVPTAEVSSTRAGRAGPAPRPAVVGRRTGPRSAATDVAVVKASSRAGVAPIVRAPSSGARAPAGVTAEVLSVAVGGVERRRAAESVPSLGARTFGAPRAGASAGTDTKSQVIAAQPPPAEARGGATERAEMVGWAGPTVEPPAETRPTRVAMRTSEPISADATAAPRRRQASTPAGLPARRERAERAAGSDAADARATPARPGFRPLVTTAEATASSRTLDARIDRGELLLALAGGAAGRRPIGMAPGEPIPAAVGPVTRRAAERSSAEPSAPVHRVTAKRHTRVADPLPTAPRAARAADPARARPAAAQRESIGRVTLRPTRAPVGRTPVRELLGRRRGGRVPFALARYSGDWDCDKTAMPNLAYQLERRVGIMLSTDAPTVDLTDPKLARQPFVFLSGHKPFRFTDAEAAALRRYIAAGGCLWINDSTAELDQTFDRAVRRELKRLLPDQRLAKLDPKHAVFRSCYDLTKGFRGYKVPPGDKYRCDYLEGVAVGGRTAVIYTRNDYGDGLEIDPHTAPLMPSLTDLSPRDMQEGSVRMGINIVLHFLHGRPGSPNVDHIAQAVRRTAARTERRRQTEIETAEVSTLDDFAEEFAWKLEPGWGDPAEVKGLAAGGKSVRMDLRFALGEKKKIAVGRDLLEQMDFSKHSALLIDVRSRLTAGCRMSVGLVTLPDWKYFESPPAYLRPGANPNVTVRLDLPNFKCEESEWKYNQRVRNLDKVRKVILLFYPLRGGTVQVDRLRLAKFKPKDPATDNK